MAQVLDTARLRGSLRYDLPVERCSARPLARREALGLAFEVHRPALLAEAVSPADWQALEEIAGASLFQTWGWLDPWSRIVAPAIGEAPAIVVGRGRSGEVEVILPLAVTRRAGVGVLGWLGQSHAAYSLPLVAPHARARMSPDRLGDLVRWAAAAVGAGALNLQNQPLMWGGDPNALALSPHRLSANDSFVLDLGGDFERHYDGLFSTRSRSQMRRKSRRLAEIGPLSIRELTGDGERQRALDAFLAQKTAQLLAQGAPSIFDSVVMQAFYRSLAERPAPGARRLTVMALTVADRFGALVLDMRHAGTAYMLNTSFSSEPQLAEASPGKLLIHAHVRACHAAGLTIYDFGPGEASYKSEWRAKPVSLAATIRGLTVPGIAVAAGLTGTASAKRVIKRTPRLWALARSIRRVLPRAQ